MRQFRSQALMGLRHVHAKVVQRPTWVRPSCRFYSSSTTSSEPTSLTKEKPFYITTPIFYVNAAPHIGHLYTMVLTDVLKRWEQLKGKEAYLCTGTDEHGIKVQRAALKSGMSPKDLCDANSQKFRDLAAAANISHDFFIRTTDDEHKQAVEAFWLRLKHAPLEDLGLYKGTHEGWYCTSDECFYTEKEVRPLVVPQTGEKIMASIQSGNEVEWIKEETWFFPLTKFRQRLLDFYDENPNWITPARRMKEVRDWVEHSLEDLSVTRPTSRVSWGIPDPEDGSNTIYVWVDALINYLTTTGFGKTWHPDSPEKGIWPANTQVIGKDIIRFHAIYWPALLMALDLPLPNKLICHTHWTMSERKMSKSIGNVVDPFLAIERWGVDSLRYFLMRNGGYHRDMPYANELIMISYNKDLRGMLGNLLSRIARPRNNRWSTVEAVKWAAEGRFDIDIIKAHAKGEQLMLAEEYLEEVPTTFRKLMDDQFVSQAIRETARLSRHVSLLVSLSEPWVFAKDKSDTGQMCLNWIIYRSVEAIRIISILLQPVMPTKAAELLDGLGVKPERRTIEFAEVGKDLDYGTTSDRGDETRQQQWKSTFPPVAEVEVSEADVKADETFQAELATEASEEEKAETVTDETSPNKA